MESEVQNAPAPPLMDGLAAGQRVCTTKGAITVDQLASGRFDAICYNSNTRRYFTRAAKAVPAGLKPVIRMHTDRGQFDLGPEQLLVLQDGEMMPAARVDPGTRLCACSIKPETGFLVTSAALDKETLDLEHLTEADCAIANWYPVPSIEALSDAEVYRVEVEGGGATPNVVVWTPGPGGGIGIVIAI